jgi:hypothetical protein
MRNAPDYTDNLIKALVHCRENSIREKECKAIVADVFASPWEDPISLGPDSILTRARAAEFALSLRPRS